MSWLAYRQSRLFMSEISIAPTLLLGQISAHRFACFTVLGTASEPQAARPFQKLLFFHCIFLPVLFHIFFLIPMYASILKIKLHFLFFLLQFTKIFHLTSNKNLLLKNSHIQKSQDKLSFQQQQKQSA